jgi:16S rRNA (adenine1518-N6/adenine1519-N6)-dimethyltransferase
LLLILQLFLLFAILAHSLYAHIMKEEKLDSNFTEDIPFVHKKSLGQNFLTSDVVPGWLCDAAKLEPGETVLEIGPGTGRLTGVLLKRGVNVLALEADLRVMSHLEETFTSEIKAGQLRLIHGDARQINPTTLGLEDKQFKVVANIPYYLSGFLLRQFLESAIQPNTLVFLMQKELVARIARAKKESLLSLSVRAFGEPNYIKTVVRGHFHPQPNVDSAILAIYNINRDNFSAIETNFFFTLLHLGLGKKRKQLIHNLSHEFKRTDVADIFNKLKLPLTVRGEDLDLETWLNLAKELQILPITTS